MQCEDEERGRNDGQDHAHKMRLSGGIGIKFALFVAVASNKASKRRNE